MILTQGANDGAGVNERVESARQHSSDAHCRRVGGDDRCAKQRAQHRLGDKGKRLAVVHARRPKQSPEMF